jgi:hypothetical protein
VTYTDHITAVARALAEEQEAMTLSRAAERVREEATQRRSEAEKALKRFNYELIDACLESNGSSAFSSSHSSSATTL